MSGESATFGGSQRSLRSIASSSSQIRRHGAGSGRMMHHSHSTPAGVDVVASSASLGRSSVPSTPRKSGKMLAIRVLMLDETTTIFQIQSKAFGRVLFEQVCKQLNLLEEDYFGLEYEEHNGTKYWLDLEKPICRQVGFSLADPFLKFCVKFYTPDPGQLEEEFTRYLFCLQIKRDLSNGSLTCNAHTAALLSSYIVQSECGDYVAEDYPNHTYLSHYKFTPKQDDALERRIMENHKKHMGQSPAQADVNLLETARRCESYGMKMHPAKDNEGAPLNLAVAHMGIVVFQNTTKINTFSWAKIRKISFKRKRFLIKLHHDVYGHYKDTMEFLFEGRNECKNFWKKCVENHGFFRCTSVKRVPRQKTRVLSRGSSFRYSGKTQRQIVEYVRDNYVKRQTFQRSQSFRHSSAGLTSMSASSVHSVNASISANPLLPLADPVELTYQLPSWNSTLDSQTMKETEVSPHRNTLTGCSNSPAHPLVATTLNSIQVETHVAPAASNHSASTSIHTNPAQSLVASKASMPQVQEKSINRVVQINKIGSLSKQESSNAHAELIHVARTRHHNTGQSPHRVIANTIRNSSPIAILRVAANNTRKPPTPPPRLTSIRPNTHTCTLTAAPATDIHVDITTRVETALCNHGTRSLPRDLISDKSYISDWGNKYQALSTGDLPETRTPQQRLSSERLEYELSRTNLYSAEQYNTSFNSCQSGRRSVSCRNLCENSFEESGRTKRRATDGFISELLSFDRIDSPITRYDDSRKVLYGSRMTTSLDIDRDFVLPDQKVYSSSYPGTSCTSADEPFGCSFELSVSHDDISHDSYEVLEKSTDDHIYQIKHSKTFYEHTRSCSLDSGNYLLSDDSVSETESKYRSAVETKSRSVNDMQSDIFSSMEDPRYLPREKMSVRSDGNFYREIQRALSSRTSSQDSHSEVYDLKHLKSSPDSSKKSHDSVYNTDSKKSRETLKSKSSDRSGCNSRASSQESKSDFYEIDNRIKDFVGDHKFSEKTRASSPESKSDYFDARMTSPELENGDLVISDEFIYNYDNFKQKIKSHDSLLSDIKSNIKTQFYDLNNTYSTIPSSGKNKETSHVHSITLKNVETEQHMRAHFYKNSESEKSNNNDINSTTTHVWPESISGLCSEIVDEHKDRCLIFRERSQDGENIFSFDKDKIESLTNIDDKINNYNMPDVVKIEKGISNTVLPSEFDKLRDPPSIVSTKKDTRKEELMAKTHFDEYNPKLILDSHIAQRSMIPLTYIHATVERTKSDPNNLANRSRVSSNSRRHMLMHQKSIDLTPADSSDEDYIYRQIPSAPPVCKTHGYFDLPKTPYESLPDKRTTNFELPKSYFKEFDDRKYVRDSSRRETIFHNDLTKVDIPYVLHKRHVMNGTAPTPIDFISKPKTKPRSPKSPKSPSYKETRKNSLSKGDDKNKRDILNNRNDTPEFLFTQNIDLSKIDPVTLEVTKTLIPAQYISSPKRDITENMDPMLLETLNSKLSQIESDSATSSKTESLHPGISKYLLKGDSRAKPCDYNTSKLFSLTNKSDIKVNKRTMKPRMQPNKKVTKNKNKQKMRITSFSSDDESLDSDDVFGSTEATPTRLEFSPPQSRKDMEPILQAEYDKITSGIWHRGQTMSSTEIEGSPPQCRRLVELESRYNSLEPSQIYGGPELRRISERSISIPSSEDDYVPAYRQNGENFIDSQGYHEKIPSPILESGEFLRTDDELYETCPEDKIDTNYDIPYTLITKSISKEKNNVKVSDHAEQAKYNSISNKMPSRTKLIEELTEMPRKGHTAILFAHARLNLSEGSAFESLQRQKATQESPSAGRRAKSLDNPVISLHRLPPMNAFSSKDDTFDFNEEGELLEEKSIEDNDSQEYNLVTNDLELPNKLLDPVLESVILDDGEIELLEKLKQIKHVRPNFVIKTKSGKISKMHRDTDWKNTSRKINYENSPIKPKFTQRPKLITQKSMPVLKTIKKPLPKDKNKKTLLGHKSLPISEKSFDNELLRSKSPSQLKVPNSIYCNDNSTESNESEIKQKPKTLDLDQTRRPKDISKSIEKLEIKKSNSKERSKSQEESDADIEKRKEKQQQLYESAMKQTVISPIKDIPPAFPAPEDKISVKTDGEKIIIETDIKSKPEDHVFIAKSPKKLESSLTKTSKSFEDAKQIDKIPKPNRSFDDRSSPSFEDKGKVEVGDIEKSPGKISRSREIKKKFEGTVVHKNMASKSKSLEQSDIQRNEISQKSKSLEEDCSNSMKSPIHKNKMVYGKPKSSRKTILNNDNTIEMNINNEVVIYESETYYDILSKGNRFDSSEADTQAVISERRKLDLMKRQSLKIEDEERSNSHILEHKPSDDDFFAEISDKNIEQNFIEGEEVCETAVECSKNDSNLLSVSNNEPLRKLSIERSRSEDTGSWITIDYEECIGDEEILMSDNENENRFKVDVEFADAVSSDNIEIDDCYKNIIITPPQDVSPVVEVNNFPGIVRDGIEVSDETIKNDRSRRDFRKSNNERSKSSETSGSWTSGEKDISPSRDGIFDHQDSSTCSSKDKGSLDDESSISCSISRPFGISQDLDKFGMLDKIKCDKLRESMLEIDTNLYTKDIKNGQQTAINNKHKPKPLEFPALDLPIQTERRLSTPTLEKQFTIDIEAGSELENDFMLNNKTYFDKVCAAESESSSSSSQLKNHTAIQISTFKNMSKNPKIELTLSTDSNPDNDRSNNRKSIHEKLLICKDKKHSLESRSSLESKASLSVESKGSFETESSSGSLGAAQRKGELALKEQQSTWKPFHMDSSGSSSLEEGWLPIESDDNVAHVPCDISGQKGFQANNTKDGSQEEEKFLGLLQQDTSTSCCQTLSSISTLSVGSSDVIMGYSSTFALARTLSRISERSTTSEKSSIDEDSTKASSHSESIRDESIISSDHHASLSSDPSNTNLAYISDTDRRTSAEMPDIPRDPAHPDRLNQLYASAQSALTQQSIQTGRFSVTQVDEPSSPNTEDDIKSKLMKSTESSQDSEDWPLPDIPKDADDSYREEEEPVDQFEVNILKDKPVPKSFSWRNNCIKSQDSDNWPSPPSSILNTPVVENVKCFYVEKPGSVTQVMVDSFTECTNDDFSRESDDNVDISFNDDHSLGVSRDSDVSAVSPCTERKISKSPILTKVLPYEDAAYFMPKDEEKSQLFSEQNCLGVTLSSATCFKSTFTSTSCCSSDNGILKNKSFDANDVVIVAQPTKSHSLSEEPIDDVFHNETVKIEIVSDDVEYNLRKTAVKQSHGSNNSDTSIDDLFTVFVDENIVLTRDSRSSVGSCKKNSHSSHSEEETSSFGTDVDGTVKMGLLPKKCTHSSHSEDTSIGLSISEWSTGTNTVRQYTNLSASESISGNKSEKSSGNFTSSNLSSSGFKSSESLSGSKSRLSLENLPEDIRYDHLTNSDTTERISSSTKSDDTTSTLTEIVHSISEWSSSTTDTLIPFDESNIKTDPFTKFLSKEDSLSDKLEIRYEKLSSIDKLVKHQFSHDIPSEEASKKRINVPEDDFTKETKSTERPVKIPLNVSQKPPISRKPIEKLSKFNKKQNLNNSLYNDSDKLSSSLQSQNYFLSSKIKSASVDNGAFSTRIVETIDKPLVKHHSYDDKTLSKNQIREYQYARNISKSQSFHEHLICHKEDAPECSSQIVKDVTLTAETAPHRPGRLSKNSSYYSSSLSSESPPIQVMTSITKPPRKTALPRSILPKSPPSGNDTDSSLDIMQQKTRDPVRRGYKRRRQLPLRRRAERSAIVTFSHRDLESSEEYFPEIESGSSDFADRPQYPDFDEEPEGEHDYQQEEFYPSYNTGGFEDIDMSTSNVDEMGFPRYDRLRSLGYARMESKLSKNTKKRQLKREDSVSLEARYILDGGRSDIRGCGLSDELCGSSEDSGRQHFTSGSTRDSYFAANIDCSNFDTSEPFDLSALPPPLFNPNENEEFSDEFQ